MVEFEFGVYRKPGNAYAYLPHCLHPSRNVFRGWLKAKMHRLLTHSSNINIWLEECHKFTITCWQGAILHALLTPHFDRFPGISEASCWSQK